MTQLYTWALYDFCELSMLVLGAFAKSAICPLAYTPFQTDDQRDQDANDYA